MSTKRPNTNRLLEVLVRLHDDVRQIQYPYSSKILKWGIISEEEIDAAKKVNANASERTVWEGLKPADVAARLAGGTTAYVDSEGQRLAWAEKGLAEGSWKVFLSIFCFQKAASEPFDSDEYYRNAELDNLLSLVRIMDEEIFNHAAMSSTPNLSASLKSKWWKECNRVFADAVKEEVYRGLNLPERPRDGICYTAPWPAALQGKIREIAARWRKAPIWDQPQSTDPNVGVDFTSNNESTIKQLLTANKFTTAYLEGR